MRLLHLRMQGLQRYKEKQPFRKQRPRFPGFPCLHPLHIYLLHLGLCVYAVAGAVRECFAGCDIDAVLCMRA